MFGTWGSLPGTEKPLTFAVLMNLRALDTVLRGEIKFHVTPKERQQSFLTLVKPQLAIIALTLLGLLWAAFSCISAKWTIRPAT